jgi:hypothetical protein
VGANHFTISASGVVEVQTIDNHGKQIDPPHSEFFALSTWIRELSAYNVMRQLRIFRLYLPRKMFRIWRNETHSRVFARTSAALKERLFVAKSAFATLLMDSLRLLHGAFSSPLMPFEGPKKVLSQASSPRQ